MDNKNTNISNHLGKNIKIMRESRGMSLNELSNKSGISISYLNRLERGKRKSPSLFVVVQIAKTFKVSVDYMLNICNITSENSSTTLQGVFCKSLNEKLKELSDEQIKSMCKIISFIIDFDWNQQETRFESMFDLSLIISAFKEAEDK